MDFPMGDSGSRQMKRKEELATIFWNSSLNLLFSHLFNTDLERHWIKQLCLNRLSGDILLLMESGLAWKHLNGVIRRVVTPHIQQVDCTAREQGSGAFHHEQWLEGDLEELLDNHGLFLTPGPDQFDL
jgi:hypothetical protein